MLEMQEIGTCRTCLVEQDKNLLKSIYRSGLIGGRLTQLSIMLADCTSLSFLQDDGLPSLICSKCVEGVSQAFSFRERCIKSNIELRERSDKNINIFVFVDTLDVSSAEGVNVKTETIQQLPTATNVEEVYEIKEDEIPSLESESILNNQSAEEEVQWIEELGDNQLASENPINEANVGDSIADKSDESYYVEEFLSDESSNEKSFTNKQTDSAENKNSAEVLTDKKISAGNSKKKRKRAPKKINSIGPPFICKVCGKELGRLSSFRYHMQIHSDVASFQCSECELSFKTKNAFDGHVMTHNDDQMHQCQLCPKKYRQSASLRNHLLTHEGGMPFECETCGKRSRQKSDAKKHTLTHKDEFNFVCQYCDKAFRFKSNLISHERIHTGEKPYACKTEGCDKKFVGSEQLKRHVRTHTGEKPFVCELCAKRFTRKSSLNYHLKTHTEVG